MFSGSFINIPQTNPKANYHAHKSEIDSAINRILESGWYIIGQEVEAFEKEFSSYIGTGHAVGVASGTDALELALRACGIGRGDTVITVSHTAVATAMAIVRVGATPFFIDVDPITFTMDPNQLEETIKNWTGIIPKAIIPVHLYGHPADMISINQIAIKYDLFVIEDCSQAHGCMIKNEKVGKWGEIGCFSFYPTKNLGGLGDGGICITNNNEINEKIRLLREYGWKERYVSEGFGVNSRLDEIQAAILRVKLKYLDDENRMRKNIANQYNEGLENSKLELPREIGNIYHVYHQYVIKTENRDELRSELKENGIGTLIHYPVPIHKQPCFEKMSKNQVQLKISEKICSEVLSLPMYPELNERDKEKIIARIAAFEI